MNLAMAATYDPDPKAPNGFRVPFNLETGELLPERWKRWLEHDPIHLVARYAKELRTLRGDLHRLRLARPVSNPLRQPACLSKALADHRVAHVYEEFDDNHSGIDYRMERSLPLPLQGVALSAPTLLEIA